MHKEMNDYILSINKFSGCVLVAYKGEIILKEGYGFADKDKGIKNTPQTNFGIGSITKSMTALSIMQLVEKNMLKLTSKIEDFFPRLYEGRGITVHHLLTHTSGIPNDFRFEEIRSGENLTPEQIISFISKKQLKSKPGQKWAYSNSNYMILALIIEKVTGEKYYDYVEEFIFRPTGMRRTWFDGERSDNLALHGKSVFNCKPSMLFGAGDVVSNVEDLYLYDQALYTELLTSNLSIDRMQEVSYKGKFIKYGYGWFLKKNFGHRSVSHGGYHPIGYTSHLERYLDDKLTIIVLSNELEKYSRFGIRYFGSTDIGRELAAIFYNRKAKPWQKLI